MNGWRMPDLGPGGHPGRCDQRGLLGLFRRGGRHHEHVPGAFGGDRREGLFCSLYADRAAHYWHTPEAGGKVDKDNPTQVGRALAQLGIELIAAYSPEARGRSERMFGTLQKRLPQELRLAGITTMEDANRYLKEVFWPAHNVALRAAGRGVRLGLRGLCRQLSCSDRHHSASSRSRQVGNDNTVRYKTTSSLQIPADRQRHHYVKARGAGARISRTASLAVFHGPQLPGPLQGRQQPDRDRGPPGRVIRFDATRRRPVDKWTARHRRPDHFPTGPTTPTEAVNSYGT